MTYTELEENWKISIGGRVTPGHRKRYKKKSRGKGIPLDEVQLNYKFCQRGILTRFYLMRSPEDMKSLVSGKNCSEFQQGSDCDVIVQIPSPLWSTCTKEFHGPSKVKGIPFTTGIYEKGIYFRVPLCGKTRPRVSKGQMEITLSFDSNEEYLRWWGKLYPDQLKKLNGMS